MNRIIIDPTVLRLAGPVPAVVHAIVAAGDTGNGVELAYSQIADSASISLSTARRAIATLCSEGLLVSEPTVEPMYGQAANRYSLPPTVGGPVQNEQPCLTNEIYRYNNESSVTSKSTGYQSNRGTQGNRDGHPGAEAGIPVPTSWDCIRSWTPVNSPMPPPANGNFMKWCQIRPWLVSYMEGYVLEWANASRRLKGWKPIDSLPHKRRLQFLRDAEILLAEHPVEKVVAVIDWVFMVHSGWLPFDVIDSYGMTRKDGERKVTSLRKIRENYDAILGVRVLEHIPGMGVKLSPTGVALWNA